MVGKLPGAGRHLVPAEADYLVQVTGAATEAEEADMVRPDGQQRRVLGGEALLGPPPQPGPLGGGLADRPPVAELLLLGRLDQQGHAVVRAEVPGGIRQERREIRGTAGGTEQRAVVGLGAWPPARLRQPWTIAGSASSAIVSARTVTASSIVCRLASGGRARIAWIASKAAPDSAETGSGLAGGPPLGGRY